jgi:hypothetical protein
MSSPRQSLWTEIRARTLEYRGHSVKETYYHHEGPYEDSPNYFFTVFSIGLENPFDVEILLEPAARTPGMEISSERIRIDNPDLEDKFVTGNKEAFIQAVFDADICRQIWKLGGRVPLLSIWTIKDTRGWQLGTETYSALDHERFQLLLDTLINLAEKITKINSVAAARGLVTSEEELAAKQQMEFDRRMNAVLAGGFNAAGVMDAAILLILEKWGRLSRNQIEQELGAAGFTLKGVKVVQALQRLVREGKVSKMLGERKVMEYSRSLLTRDSEPKHL